MTIKITMKERESRVRAKAELVTCFHARLDEAGEVALRGAIDELLSHINLEKLQQIMGYELDKSRTA